MTITISWLSFSRPLTISVSNAISVGVRLWVITISMVSLGHMDRSSSISMAIAISWLSIGRPLAITITISITTIVSTESLWASVGVAGSMAITISWLSLSRPLTISVSNVISVGVRLWVITISMVSLGHMDRSSSISMT